jgi:hypothetical protein
MSDIRQPSGQPIGGQFANHNRDEATMTLERPPIASAKDVQSIIDNAVFEENERADDDEVPVVALTWRDACNSVETLGDEALSSLVDGDPKSVRQAFNYRASQEGLETALPTTATRRSSASHLSLNDEQNPASQWVDNRLTEYEDIGHHSRADYAEVGEEGIAYGLHINPEYLAEVVGGAPHNGESHDDFIERVTTDEPDYYKELDDFFTEQYGAELLNDGGEMDTVEFFISYEDGGAEKSTVEYMGDRVEHETKLLALKNEWTYGSTMQSAWAKKLGYRYELSTNADRQFGDGHWVKDE